MSIRTIVGKNSVYEEKKRGLKKMVEMVKIKNVIDNRMQCTPKPWLSLPQDVLEVKPINGFRTGSGALR